MSESKNTWEVVDGDFVDTACADCVHNLLVGRGIEHELGANYSDEASGVYASEDLYDQHYGCEHKCFDCGVSLG